MSFAVAGEARTNRRAVIAAATPMKSSRDWWEENLRVHREGKCEECNRMHAITKPATGNRKPATDHL